MAFILVFVAWLNWIPSLWFSNIVIITAVIVGGYPIFKESGVALRKGRINMELSMVIAIFASLFLLEFLPAIAITFFALLSEFVEEFIVERGRRNIELLYKNAPKKAIVRNNKTDAVQNDFFPSSQMTREIPVDEVAIGDIVIVREGDAIPIDGTILNGSSTVDQSSITGESMPVEKNAGDFVFASTINLDNKLEIKCEKTFADTTYAKIIHLVEESESSKAPIQKLSDKMATRLIQFAIGLSVLTFIVTQNLVSTLSVIVVAGACGLAVGTPIALLASNSKLAKKGIIVKGGSQIENTSNAGIIVFDKTGTLTVGKPEVTKVISFSKTMGPNKILEYAAIAERDINHPLAKSIVEKAKTEKIEVKESHGNGNSGNFAKDISVDDGNKNTKIRAGKGVSVFHKGQLISVGNIKFIEEQFQFADSDKSDYFNQKSPLLSNSPLFRYLLGSGQPQELISRDKTMDDTTDTSYPIPDKNDINLLSSSTAVFIALDKEVIGAILLEDKIREGSKEAISKLKSMNLHPIMLTGDNENTAKKIAKESGIEEYYANMLPEDKVTKIKEIVGKQNSKKKRKSVIMVGDGINDAPALAEADVGVAMGKTGTDVVIETADVILMTENLTKIPYLVKSSKRTIFTIKQNFFGTLLIDGLGFVLAFVGLLNPLLAAVIHVVSELVFIINSARLLRD